MIYHHGGETDWCIEYMPYNVAAMAGKYT